MSISNAVAQEQDTLIIIEGQIDSAAVQDNDPKTKKARKLNLTPIQVGAMSAIVPGAGQIYNRKYWKLPLVYAGIGGIGYLIYDNTNKYRTWKNYYALKVTGEPVNLPLSAEGIKNYRDRYRKNLESSYIGAIGVFVLIGVDAFIDAHMAGYDVSDDLSLDFKSINIGGDAHHSFGSALSIGLAYQIK